MRKLFERFPFLEQYLSPFMFSGNQTPATGNVSANASEITSIPSMPPDYTVNSVIPRSSNIRNFSPEDDGFGHLEEMINRSSLQLQAQTTFALPHSPALITYYSQASHLAYLSQGVLPLNISNALSTLKSTNKISGGASNTSSQISLHKVPRSVVYRENALDAFSSKVLLPNSPVKPVFLNEEQFIECCVIATFVHLLKKGAPIQDSVILQNLFRGLPGKNINNLQYLAAYLTSLKSPIDFKEYISPALLETLSAENIAKLQSITLTTDATFLHEIVAMAKINSQQSSQLSFTGFIKNSNHSVIPRRYYNNSGNVFPDYVLALSQAVGPYTHMGVDFKFTKKGRGNYDIVKGCSDNLEHHIITANRELKRNVQRILNNANLTEQDRDMGNDMLSHIDHTGANYVVNNDINHYVLSSNGLRETFSDFLIRNKIGVNLITPISVDDMSLNAEVTAEFSRTFKHFYLSEDSSLLTFFNETAKEQNGSLGDLKVAMLTYSKKILLDFSF